AADTDDGRRRLRHVRSGLRVQLHLRDQLGLGRRGQQLTVGVGVSKLGRGGRHRRGRVRSATSRFRIPIGGRQMKPGYKTTESYVALAPIVGAFPAPLLAELPHKYAPL